MSTYGIHRTHNDYDLVVTWVNGSDPNWQKLFINAQQDEGVNVSTGQFEERFISHDELRYVLRSINHYYPWYRKLFLVTANQIPSWINVSHPRLRIVSHDELFPSTLPLPSFNSNSIEFALHNIPDLSEHFLYFNDDMFFKDYFYPSDFFTDNGTLLFATDTNCVWTNPRKRMEKNLELSGIETNNRELYFTMCYRSAALCEDYFQTQQRGEPLHFPIPLSKTVLHEVAKAFEHDVNVTIHNRFRKVTDLQFETTVNLYGSQTHLGHQIHHKPDYAFCYITDRFKLLEFQYLQKREFALNYVAAEWWDSVEQIFNQWWPQPSPFEKN